MIDYRDLAYAEMTALYMETQSPTPFFSTKPLKLNSIKSMIRKQYIYQ